MSGLFLVQEALAVLILSSLTRPPYLDVQGGEVAVEVFGVVDVRLPADGTHHVSDMFVPDGDGEVLLEAPTAHGALTGRQRLHLK